MSALDDRVIDKGVPRGGFLQFVRSLNGTPPLIPISILSRSFPSYPQLSQLQYDRFAIFVSMPRG